MPRPKPALIVVPLLIAALGITSYIVEGQRSRQRSVLSGFFENQPTQVASRIEGRIASIYVKEGDHVHAGQPLLLLETKTTGLDTETRVHQAEQARSLFEEMKNGPRHEEIARQTSALAEAEANLAKLQNGPLPEEIDQAKARLSHAEAMYEKAIAGPRREEIDQARAEEKNTLARLAQAQRGLTLQERAEAKARLDAATSAERQAKSDAERYSDLYRGDAISKQQAEQKQTDYEAARAKRIEMEQAWRLADSGTPKEEMDQAREAHNQSVAALKLLLAGTRKEDIRSAEADVAEAKKAVAFLTRGYRSEDIAAARARAMQARASLDELNAGSRTEDIRQSKAAEAAARSAAESAKANLNENLVTAPIDGIVERLPVAVGDLVAANTVVIRVSNLDDIWLRVYVPEANLRAVTVGADTQLKIDGVKDSIPALVESISTQGEFTPANLQTPDDRGKQVFGVRIRLKSPDARVKAGMYATVIEIGRWKP